MYLKDAVRATVCTISQLCGHSTSNAGFRTAGSAKRALVWATRAQQFGAHSQLVDDSILVDHKEIMTSITKIRISAITDKRQLAQDLLSIFEAKSATAETKTPADDEDGDTIGDTDDLDYDPNKDLVEDEEEDEEIVEDEDDVETMTDKRKQWLKLVRQMSNEVLASPAIYNMTGRLSTTQQLCLKHSLSRYGANPSCLCSSEIRRSCGVPLLPSQIRILSSANSNTPLMSA